MKKSLLLVDASNLLFRSYYATAYTGNLMQNSSGMYTNGIYGFAHAMTKLINEGYTHILVAMDSEGKTHRHEIYDDYKGTRKETPVELKEQFPYMKEYLKALGVYAYEQEGIEADDIIGYVVKNHKDEFDEITIYSNDHDLIQLLEDNVRQLISRKGLKEIDYFTNKSVVEKLGFRANQVIDFKGLVGDTSDNIPGIPGVGEKTAVKLLQEFESLEGIYRNIDEIKGKLKEKLIEHHDIAKFSKKLATILTDFKNDIEIDKTEYRGYKNEELLSFYQKMNFNSFMKSLSKDKEIINTSYLVLDSLEKVNKINYQNAYLHLEIFGDNYHTDKRVGFGLIMGNDSYYLPYDIAIKSDRFKAFLTDKEIEKYVYDLKQLTVALLWDGIKIENCCFDLLLSAYLTNASIRQDDFSLVVQSLGYDQVLADEHVYGKGAKFVLPEKNEYIKHIMNKVKAIKSLKKIALEKNISDNQLELLEKIEIPLAKVLAEMEFIGICVDREVLEEFGENLRTQKLSLETRIYDLANKEFNINSPKQLGEVLFDELNLPTQKKIKSGYSTDISVLNKLVKIHPIIKEIIKYRTYSKLYSTYYEGLKHSLNLKNDSRIHTIYQQALTKTGRLSSKEPNLQNIPIKTDEGRELRKVFIANDNNVLLSFDYSQIELRVVCELAGAKNLKKAFLENLDIHKETAKKIFGKDEIGIYERSVAKAINFSIIYGKTAWGLSEDLDISLYEAEKFINSYFENYPEIKTYIPEIMSKNYQTRQFGQRIAMNAPIQGTAADILKIAMVLIDKRFKEEDLLAKIILQIHDEIVIDVPEHELEKVISITKEVMENAVDFETLIVANYASGKNLYEVK